MASCLEAVMSIRKRMRRLTSLDIVRALVLSKCAELDDFAGCDNVLDVFTVAETLGISTPVHLSSAVIGLQDGGTAQVLSVTNKGGMILVAVEKSSVDDFRAYAIKRP